MTTEEHRDFIADEASKKIKAKYDKGQAEHGGYLWLKKGLLDFAIEEAIDQIVYLLTLKQQIDEGITPTKEDNKLSTDL